MKKIISLSLIICMLILIVPTPTLANDAALGGTGISVYPIYDTDVVMEEEIIEILVKDGRVYVYCTFFFYNTGETTDILMGFPTQYPGHIDSQQDLEEKMEDEYYDYYTFPRLERFRTYADGIRVPITLKKGLEPEGNNKGSLYFPQWYTWNINFKENQRIKITNSYSFEPGFSGENSLWFEYILRSGATWKGPVGKITVRVRFHEHDMTNVIFQGMLPTYIDMDGTIVWEAENIEPEKDIELVYKQTVRNLSYPVGLSVSEHDKYEYMGYRYMRNFNAHYYNGSTWWANKLIRQFGDQQSDRFYYYTGISYYKKERYDKALEMLISIEKYSPRVEYYKSLIYYEIGENQLYTQSIKELINYNPYDSAEEWLSLWARFRLAELENSY